MHAPWYRRPVYYVDRLLPIVAVGAVVSLALEFGFYKPPLPVRLLIAVQLMAVALYVTSRVLNAMSARFTWRVIAGFRYDGVILAVAAMIVAIELGDAHAPAVTLSAAYVATLQVALGVRLTVEAIQLRLLLSPRVLQPTQFVLLAFILMIGIGTMALALPRASHPEHFQASDFSLFRHVLDSAFTATSATCVTGLIVRDTGADFTRFGQVVILLLIQMGGLGIMVFSSVLGSLAGRALSLRDSLVLQDETSHQTLGELRALVRFIVASTFAFEVIGGFILYPAFGDLTSASERVFHAVFHAVSAFCNAGFALQSDSLESFRQAWPTYVGVMPLIVLGGIGFPVLKELWEGVKKAPASRRFRIRAVALNRRSSLRVLSVHSRLVLVTTAVLIALSTILFMILDSLNPASAGTAPGARLLDALFLSITCRTAGFNTTAMGTDAISPATHMFAAILMFIGGSPGSTAGGVKTASVAVMMLGVWATLRGRRHVEVYSRRIPEFIVRRASVVMAVMAALVSAVTLLLCLTEGVTLREAMFETVSAAATVGLSTGLTPELTEAGRVVIMVTMLAGRLGPLTVLVAMAGRPKQFRYEFPDEAVMIG